MKKQDTRWQQRFFNYVKALHKLEQAVDYVGENLNDHENKDVSAEAKLVINEMMKEGLIQRFEYTHELAWNVMKDYAIWQGNNTVGGSRDATREAFALKLIANGEVWMDMIGSRNKTSHTYHSESQMRYI